MRRIALRFREHWGKWAVIWWVSFGTLIGLYMSAGVELSGLLVPGLQGSIIGLALLAMHAYARRIKR